MSDAVPSVMLVEPDVLVRQPLAEYLRDCGFKVMEAQSAAEARKLLADGPPIDIVVADAALPDGESFALARELRSSRPDIQVILAGTPSKITAEAGDLCHDEGPALAKPYGHAQVLDRIKQLLAARDRAKGAA